MYGVRLFARFNMKNIVSTSAVNMYWYLRLKNVNVLYRDQW